MNSQNSLHVVVIEDDESLLRLYETNFKNAEFSIGFKGFKLGQDAIEYMQNAAADLVIVDMRLPDKSGFELINTLYDTYDMYGTSIIVISGMDEAEIRSQGALKDDVSILSKPVPFAYLMEKMKMMHTFKFGFLSPSS